MNDNKKCIEQAEDIDNVREIARLEKLAEETEEKLSELNAQIRELKTKNKHKFKLFIRRLDVVGGLHWMKLLVWIGIASAALGYTFIDYLSLWMDWGLPICGILSTCMELINSIVEND